MRLGLKTFVFAAGCLFVAGSLGVGAAMAEDPPVRIGILNDMSGVFADYQGPGSVVAAQLAVEDYGGKVAGRKIEVISADHQNKVDIGTNIARKWFELDGVDAIFDVPNSSIAFAVADLAREKNKVFIGSGAGSDALTGAKCSPNTVHWTYDTYAYGHGIGKAIVARGGKKWFFITADYSFGKDLEKQTAEAVVANGGTVAGAVRHPLGTADYSSYLLQAEASGADVIAFANAGADTTNAMKQAAEFNLGKDHKLVGVILGIEGIPGLGLAAAQGSFILNPFYWDYTDAGRAFTKRYVELLPSHNVPDDMQVGVYASVLHYLKAVEKLGSASDGRAVVAKMKELPTDDPLFGKGYIRPDGRKIHPMYLQQVKTPAESQSKWDVLKVVATVPGEEAFRPLKDGNCPLVN
ncbi:MAG: ABC transporter substrate-binding protein [Beijerinckiaceae bacterium]